MKTTVKLGKFWGIPISLHAGWFLIFGMIPWSLAAGYFPAAYPDLLTSIHWALGGIISVLFFASVLAHELGHSYLTLRNKIPVSDITLFVFGGVSQIEQEPKSPGAEFRIAIAGPVVSLALAALFGGLWLMTQNIVWLAAPSMWLARMNLMLFLFNMIPGFPLDGGRVLRAIIWRCSSDFRMAARAASLIGQLIAQIIMGFGLLS